MESGRYWVTIGINERFTEGFETADLREALALTRGGALQVGIVQGEYKF